MDQKLSMNLLFSLIIHIVFAFSVVTEVFSVDPQFSACKPESCGYSIRISFPFYIRNRQPSFCGFPGFEVSCGGDGSTILQLSNSTYVIHEISYSNQSLRISTTCDSLINNMSLPRQFNLSQDTTELLLFYNCLLPNQSTTEHNNYLVGCMSEGEKNGLGLVMFRNDSLAGYASDYCSPSVVVAHVDFFSGESLGAPDLLDRGFTLNWVASECSRCIKSGGKCGFDEISYQFRCFCPDRPHLWTCASFETSRSRIAKVALVAVTPVSGIVMLIAITFCLWKKLSSKRKAKTKVDRKIEACLRSYGSLTPQRYSFRDIKKMTESFKEKLGQGGYGGVFKGKLPDGRLVAVKVLKELKGNGEEFINEVASISRTSHVNIVTLLGFCFDGTKRALVYEFMPNGSLDKYINKENDNDHIPPLGMDKLYQIALGIARGLEYLHQGCNTRILHFDIKPHNILMDENFCPKISDFGLAKVCPERDQSIVTMSGARGTIGYIAPEVFLRYLGRVSHKSDVYSYGMMVLEISGARKLAIEAKTCTSELYFPQCVFKFLELAENVMERQQIETEIARKMMIVGLWCIQTDPSIQPPMGKVLEMLEGSLESLQMPPAPFLSSQPILPFVEWSSQLIMR